MTGHGPVRSAWWGGETRPGRAAAPAPQVGRPSSNACAAPSERRLAARRGDRRRRGDGDVLQRLARQKKRDAVLRRRRLPPADHRGGEDPGRGLGIEVVVGDPEDASSSTASDVCRRARAVPGDRRRGRGLRALRRAAHEHGAMVVVATDLLALLLLTPPGEWGADIAVGNSPALRRADGLRRPARRRSSPPRKNTSARCPAASSASRKDVHGNPALRMALQTREQHIRRDKATSNICTAQVLLAIIAGDVRGLPRPRGPAAIAERVRGATKIRRAACARLGYEGRRRRPTSTPSRVDRGRERRADDVIAAAAARINLRRDRRRRPSASRSTRPRRDDGPRDLCSRLRRRGRMSVDADGLRTAARPTCDVAVVARARTSDFLTHPSLPPLPQRDTRCCATSKPAARDLSLDDGDDPARLVHDEAQRHRRDDPGHLARVRRPAPLRAARSRRRATSELFERARGWLAEITGFAAVSLQPNAGSQGEYAGLLVIRAYHRANGDEHRNVCLIPTSAHGTNPASAVMAGMKVVVVACDDDGNIDVDDLRAKAEQHKDEPRGAHGHLPLDPRRVRGGDPRDLRHRPRARRPGLHGRRQHERPGRPLPPGRLRRRRLPPQPAQDLLHPARRRRSRHGPDRRRAAPGAVPARPPAGRRRRPGRRAGDRRGLGRALGQPEHPADLLDVHRHDGRARACAERPRSRSSTPTTWRSASRTTTRCSTPGPNGAPSPTSSSSTCGRSRPRRRRRSTTSPSA